MTDDVLTRQKATPGEYGKTPEERTVDEMLDFGVVVVDKPSGPTSHQVAAYVQKILGIDKAGHSGTLDPKVTGVLPTGTGRATRLLEYLLKSGKGYVGIMHLHDDVEAYRIHQAAEKFIGEITQLPPKRSSVKRAHRQRTIYEFRFLEIRGRDILFYADVEAGTYIRKLCHDFGEQLGIGAHMAELRRTRVAHFNEQDAVTLQELTDAYAVARDGDEKAFRRIMLPAEEIVKNYPFVSVLDSAVNSLTHGAALKVPGIAQLSSTIERGDAVRLITLKGELIGMGTARLSSQEMLAEKGLAVTMDKVLLPDDVYPRLD